ncbi:MAG: hypothetical protein LBJ67_03650 [Planctomycetaceae bacterium]|jgi:DNA modification methylase|nr:hypothetical protein [Planctomycetaceae bacterium]
MNDDSITILEGDCRELLKDILSDSIDCIFTSPPYADARKKIYGGVSPEKYVEWFLPISRELLRILKPSGTFILNIKEKVVNGERNTYVLDVLERRPTAQNVIGDIQHVIRFVRRQLQFQNRRLCPISPKIYCPLAIFEQFV